MMPDRKQHPTDAERWEKPDSYSSNWSERNKRLLDMLDANEPDAARWTFTEYGCGPNAPFQAAVLRNSQRKVHLADRVAWNADCAVVDFNTNCTERLPSSEVAVLSGVVEYINDVPGMLDVLKDSHQVILMSYAIRQSVAGRPDGRVEDCVREINERASVHGWRNHFDFEALLQLIAPHAFIRSAEMWGTQILLLGKFT